MSKLSEFKEFCARCAACSRCPELKERSAVMSGLNGTLYPKIMFVAEAPGRLGADRTRKPFFGDKSGENFDKLLASIGLSRRDIFITNSILCSPRSLSGANRRPKLAEIKNCSPFLKRTIELVNPPVIATLGAVALSAIELIEPHGLKLAGSAGKDFLWNGRRLVPLYHPSPQTVAAQRGLELQLRHFRILAGFI